MTTIRLTPERQSPRDVEAALRELKKKLEAEGTLKALRDKEQYDRPSIRRKKKRTAAVQRWQRAQAKNKLPEKRY